MGSALLPPSNIILNPPSDMGTTFDSKNDSPSKSYMNMKKEIISRTNFKF